MPRFVHSSTIDAPAQAVFDWHTRPGAFERLLPPWESVEVESRTGGIRDGDRVTLRSRVGPLWTRWVVEHRDYREGEQFRDVQISGPFRSWQHTHRVIPNGPNESTLTDEIEYELPMGLAGRLLGGSFVETKLRRLFAYRHAVTAADVRAHQAVVGRPSLRVMISGSTGLIGANLVPLLTTGGHDVIRLVRDREAVADRNAHWDTASGRIEADHVGPVDAVVHLAGESIAGRWTADKKKRIRDSRVEGTRQIVDWIKAQESPPRTLICASAIGFYGDRGDALLTEQSDGGDDFLAEVCAAWEREAGRAASDQTRVVNTRFGVVLSPRGGALAKMLTPFKLGGGGIIGNGRQSWSWVGVDDAAGAILHALQNEGIDGPVNVVAPSPATNREFTKALGRALGRPTIAPMPAPAARIAFGEMADALLLASQRVAPAALRLATARYSFLICNRPSACGRESAMRKHYETRGKDEDV